VVAINSGSCRRTATGYDRRSYSAVDVDLVAAYCAELDTSYLLVPRIFAGQATAQLRLSAPRNNQRRGIHWASDHELAATLRALGP
jgi:hypothetical protein